jgi:hypothetical protein
MAKKTNTLRSRILSSHDLKTSTVSIPEWGTESEPLNVKVQELNAAARNDILKLHGEVDALSAACKTIEMGVLDDDGSLAFEEGDAAELAKKSEAIITKLYKEIMKLSGVNLVDKPAADTEGQEETPAGKPLEKTSSSGATTDSCSSSESQPTAS